MADDPTAPTAQTAQTAPTVSRDGGGDRDITGNLADNPLPGSGVVDERHQYGDGQDVIAPLLEEMLHRVSAGRDWWRQNHDAARQDVEFAYNEQWPASAKADRKGRPALTFNLLPQYIHNVLGQAKMSKFNIHIIQTAGPNEHIPVWAGGATMYPPAEIMEGLIRDIEKRSRATRAYVRALQHAVEGGFGWLWVRTTRPYDNPFEIEIRIEHRKDRWGVLMDPQSEQDDFSDARWGLISDSMSVREYQSRYPDAPMTGWGVGSGFDQQYRKWWGSESSVRVAHYYYKEPKRRTALKFVNPEGIEILGYLDELEPVVDEIIAMGYVEQGRIEVDSYCVKHIMCTATHVLDGPNDWPGSRIPLVPVIGREINLDGYNHYAGLVRWAYDPQRMFNYFVSSAIERVALSPKAPWIATANQIAGHEAEWKDQHKRNIAVLIYNHEDGADAPRRQEPATMPTAEMQIVLHTRQAVQETIGMYEASIGKKSNETSGVAIQKRQSQGNATTYDFIDNLAYAIGSVGELVAHIIPNVYSGDATRRIILADDSQARVQLNHEIVDKKSGKTFRVGNLSLYRYTCTVKPGPAFASVREEFVSLMTEWGRSDPEALQAVRDLIVQNLDVPNARELSRRFKMLTPRWLLRPEDQQNLPQPPQPPPTPEQQAEIAKGKAVEMKAQTDVQIAEIRLEEQKIALEIEKTRLQEANVKLETSTEKGAAEVSREEREGEEQGGAQQDEKRMEGVAKRVFAQMSAGKSKG